MIYTNISNTITKFIANYIKGLYLTNYTTSTQHQLISGVPQGSVLSPTLFNIFTSHIPTHLKHIQLISSLDDITITVTPGNTQSTTIPTQHLCLDQIKQSVNQLRQNDLYTHAHLSQNFESHPQLTYNKHIDNLVVKASKTIPKLKIVSKNSHFTHI